MKAKGGVKTSGWIGELGNFVIEQLAKMLATAGNTRFFGVYARLLRRSSLLGVRKTFDWCSAKYSF